MHLAGFLKAIAVMLTAAFSLTVFVPLAEAVDFSNYQSLTPPTGRF